MYKCKCGREFEKPNSLRNHGRFCNKYENKVKQKSIYKINENCYKCECNKEFVSSQSLLGHFSHCVIHNNGEISQDRFGDNRAWSKGLTKENSEGVNKMSSTLKEKYASGEIVPHSVPHTDETKDHLSKKRILYLDSHDGYCKWYLVFNGEKEIKVQGTWEKAVAEKLTSQNINWERGYPLIYSKIKRYMPDFYLPDFDIFIEVKGYWDEKTIDKMNKVIEDNNVDIRIIDDYKTIKNISNVFLDIFKLERYSNEICKKIKS